MRTLFFIICAIVCVSINAQKESLKLHKYDLSEVPNIRKTYNWKRFARSTVDYSPKEEKLTFKLYQNIYDNGPVAIVEYHTVNPDGTNFWDNIVLIDTNREKDFPHYLTIPSHPRDTVSYPFIKSWFLGKNGESHFERYPVAGANTDQTLTLLYHLLYCDYAQISPKSTEKNILYNLPYLTKLAVDTTDYSIEKTDFGVTMKFHYADPKKTWHSVVKLANSRYQDPTTALIWDETYEGLAFKPFSNEINTEEYPFYVLFYKEEIDSYMMLTLEDNMHNSGFIFTCWQFLTGYTHSINL